MHELAPLLHGDALTVTGASLADGFAGAEALDRARDLARSDLRSRLRAASPSSAAASRPDGALIKRSAASPELLRHRGAAVVFEDVYDVAARIDDPALDVGPTRCSSCGTPGPRAGRECPSGGSCRSRRSSSSAGVTDLVRVSDARMSGTAFGTVVLHVAPEAAVGGPLRAVRDGDPIVLDVDEQRLDLDLPAAEIERRLAELGPAEPKYRRGYGALYLEHVLQANEGCDFDFLRADGEPAEREPLGLLSGWVGGW